MATSFYTTGAPPTATATTGDNDATAAAAAASVNQGFAFRQRRERVNWYDLATIDVDQVIRQADVMTLQKLLENVTFCDSMSDDFRHADPHFVKLFRIAQLTIEYLLHSQHQLNNARIHAEEQVSVEKEAVKRAETKLLKLEEESERIKKESKKRRKTIAAQQMMLNSGTTNNSFFKCTECPKAFVSLTFLKEHTDRRHPNRRPFVEVSQIQQPQQEQQRPLRTEAENSELNELRVQVAVMQERLKMSESRIREDVMSEQRLTQRSNHNNVVGDDEQQQDEVYRTLKEMKSIMKGLVANQQQNTSSIHDHLASHLGPMLDDDENSVDVGKKNGVAVVPPSTTLKIDETKLNDEVNRALEVHLRAFEAEKEDMKRALQKELRRIKESNRISRHRVEEAVTAATMLSTNNSTRSNRRAPSPPKVRREKMSVSERIETARPRTREFRQSFSVTDTSHSDELLSLSGEKYNSCRISPSPSPPPSSIQHSVTSNGPITVLTEGVPPLHYRPFPKHAPFIRARYEHSTTELRDCRNDLIAQISEELESRGIPSNCTGLPHAAYEAKRAARNHERSALSRQYEDFSSTRFKLLNNLLGQFVASSFSFNPKLKKATSMVSTRNKSRSLQSSALKVSNLIRVTSSKGQDQPILEERTDRARSPLPTGVIMVGSGSQQDPKQQQLSYNNGDGEVLKSSLRQTTSSRVDSPTKTVRLPGKPPLTPQTKRKSLSSLPSNSNGSLKSAQQLDKHSWGDISDDNDDDDILSDEYTIDNDDLGLRMPDVSHPAANLFTVNVRSSANKNIHIGEHHEDDDDLLVSSLSDEPMGTGATSTPVHISGPIADRIESVPAPPPPNYNSHQYHDDEVVDMKHLEVDKLMTEISSPDPSEGDRGVGRFMSRPAVSSSAFDFDGDLSDDIESYDV